MNSKRKGSLAIGEAIGYFISKGQTVLLPVADCDKYDLVIDENNCLKKIQCKYSSAQETSGAYIVDLRTFGGYREKTYYIKYKENDFDYLFVYCSNGESYFIPAEKVINKVHISLGKKSWNEYNVKQHAEFA
ncbi:MAG TPA: group I intron-associated PD-(D/E)XK endonuclease [Patescibacteria group bacterium]|nr:group I intron-associated PD-(D/E)XK endonuclease [Patescibacteria group bacterium]